jgi:hypothetical protein
MVPKMVATGNHLRQAGVTPCQLTDNTIHHNSPSTFSHQKVALQLVLPFLDDKITPVDHRVISSRL